MTARPVPLTAEPSIMYAVMTPVPLGDDDLIAPPSTQLLRHYGSSEEAISRLLTRQHQTLLMRASDVDNAASAHRDTRVEALLLAERHDGVVIDLGIPRIVEGVAEGVSLAHATQWYVVDYASWEARELRTIGLSGFGLPEIVIDGIDRERHPMFSAVLAGLVHRLLGEWPANDPVGEATITLRDIAYGLGDAAASQTPDDRSVDVSITYEDDTLIVRLLTDPATALFAP